MRTEREVWEWVWDDDDESILPPLERFRAAEAPEPAEEKLEVLATEEAPEAAEDELGRLERSLLSALGEPAEDERPETEDDADARPAEVVDLRTRREPELPAGVATTLVVAPQRARRAARKRLRRRVLVIALASALAGAATFAALELRSRRAAEPTPPPPPAAAAEQRVVAFAIWDEGAPGYLAVLTRGGGKEPVAVVVPDTTSVTVPGQGLRTVADAIESGDVTIVQATVENILGVRVDDALGLPLDQLTPIVDAVGLLDLGGELASGDEVVEYLRDGARAPAPDRLSRWHEVLTSLLTAARTAPDALEDVPARVRSVFTTGADVVHLPTDQIGAGLVSPDDPAVEELVADRFVPSATDGIAAVRLVVLNGNGTPGVGEAVARLLVPEGFRLITNENAETFDLEETQILATSREFLDEARLARRLLGVGSVYLGGPPSGVADVTVVVGDDFRSP